MTKRYVEDRILTVAESISPREGPDGREHPAVADIAAFAYKTLETPEHHAQIGEHVAGCAHCQKEVAQAILCARAGDTSKLTPPQRVTDRIMNSIDEVPQGVTLN